MAQGSNPGEFGNRGDTEEQASEGGQQSPGKFGSSEGADPAEAGKAGAAAQPEEAKAEGGRNSGSGQS